MDDKNPKRRKITDGRRISGTENRVSAIAEERSDSPDRVAVADPAADAFRISRIFEGYDIIFNILNHLGERERPRYILINRTWRTVFVESQKQGLFYFRRPSREEEERLANYLLQYVAPDETMTSALIRLFLLTRNNRAMKEQFKRVRKAFTEFRDLRRLTKRGRSDGMHGFNSFQSLLQEPHP